MVSIQEVLSRIFNASKDDFHFQTVSSSRKRNKTEEDRTTKLHQKRLAKQRSMMSVEDDVPLEITDLGDVLGISALRPPRKRRKKR